MALPSQTEAKSCQAHQTVEKRWECQLSKKAVSSLDRVQIFWHAPLDKVSVVKVETADAPVAPDGLSGALSGFSKLDADNVASEAFNLGSVRDLVMPFLSALALTWLTNEEKPACLIACH